MSQLTTTDWQARADAHRVRVQQWTTPRRERRSRGESHPVYDFLFQYYHYSAGKLETWHPNPGEQLENSDAARALFGAPEYHVTGDIIQRNARAMTDSQRTLIQHARQLLRATQERPANFGCFGMHEWAMVYGGHEVRHAEIAPLRLPQAELDAFVESRPVACSHFDAFRFFTPAAKPMNRLPITWPTRDDHEQPGCIHANMDLYRWAYSAMPWVGSDLLWDCFSLAVDLRVLDMQAGPYDLRAMGFEPVCIETSNGREEYQRRQRALSERAGVLRHILIDMLDSFERRPERSA